jgi:Fe-S cluster biogenesis protein NfuA
LSVHTSRRQRSAAVQASRAEAQTAAPTDAEKARLASLGGVVTDAAVPEGHKGLHGFLYGDGGAEEHDARQYSIRHGEDDGQTVLPVADYLEARDGEKPVGVYALYDVRRELQYVGFARNIVLAVKGHLERVGDERCAHVKAMVFANKAMATRSNLEREAANWTREAGTTPPGNGVEAELWATGVSTATMSDAERAAYEEKKLKMRKAMGENLGDAVPGETRDAKQRRLDLIRAVEGDDWSSVIDGQTAETVAPPAAEPVAAAAAAAPIDSPFSRVNVHRSIGNGEAAPAVEMTVDSVDRALEEVRPYLIADGGNFSVAGVTNGVVMLQLEGACGTCASSTATMKMGIERALKSAFGDALKEVQQVGAIDTSATMASVDAHLDMLRPAISNYGGSVVVREVKGGKCTVKYDGPPPIAMGVKAAIKDKFPDINSVVFED